MKSSIIGERLTAATFLVLILSASMVGLSLSIKDSENHPHHPKAATRTYETYESTKRGSSNEIKSNKAKETFGCECMLRTVSISFRNFGLLADLDQVMLPPPNEIFDPVEKEPQEKIRSKTEKFLHGICPDKFVSEKNSYPSTSTAQGKHVKNNSKRLTSSNVKQINGSNPNSKENQNAKAFDPWSVNVARCLGICSSPPLTPTSFRFTNNSLYGIDSSITSSQRKRSTSKEPQTKNSTKPPTMDDEVVKSEKLNKLSSKLPSESDIVCTPTLIRRKKIAIRIPWNIPPSDFNPSTREAKSKSSKTSSPTSNAHAQKG